MNIYEINNDILIRLKEVICSEMKLFLIFDYLEIDLKKYIEEKIPKDFLLDPNDI